MHPANAIALSHDAQDLFDSLMWSIEAQVVDNGTVRQDASFYMPSSTVTLDIRECSNIFSDLTTLELYHQQ
jgi:hypothetical protein